ncbi:helix-turn-helix transcriptional regulator [Streptomyces scopuliridis]|uniref:helix-turn-helix transcriptional regulator n=1 Tax=Streptomyces scopuliridis TaxID=452529 RepID=UPI003681268F
MLHVLGLSGHAETIYRAALQYPDHGVLALCEDSGLSEAEVRAALDELAALALVKPSDQYGERLRLVSPEVGLATLLASAEATLAERQAQLQKTRAEIAAMAANHRDTRSSESVVRLPGLDAVRARLEELQQTTEFECLSLNPGGAHKPDARNAATPLNEEALRRGVTIRAVCRESFRNDAATLLYARWLTEHGGHMRTLPTVPIQMIVIDRRTAILPLTPTEPRSGALEINSPGVVAALCAFFELCWSKATLFGEQPPSDKAGCTPMERALLEFVANGDTDEAAGRKLGISLRTARRMMATLMERLDASSRFQAGVHAAKRGWL